jgi:hypothetical protein
VPVKTKKEALDFVKRHGAVLESAKGTIPSLAQAIAGEPIRGSWWGHPKGNQIYMLLNDVCDSPDVMRCRLHDGKITLVHRRLWPALVRMAHTFDGARLSVIREEHTSAGAHRVTTVKFPDWVSADVHAAAKCISAAEAEEQLGSLVTNGTARKSEARRWSKRAD